MTLFRSSSIAAFTFFFAFLAPSFDAFAFTLPTNDGFFTDAAQIIDDEQEVQMEQYLKEYAGANGAQTAILTIPSIPAGVTLEELALQILEKWRIGSATDGNGIFMMYAYAERRFIIVTTAALSQVLSSDLLSKIVESDVQPELKEGKYDQAFAAALDSIARHRSGEYSSERFDEPSASASFGSVLLFFIAVIATSAAAYFFKDSRIWAGLIGGILFGSLFGVLHGKFLTLPLLMTLGGVFDLILRKKDGRGRMKHRSFRRRRRPRLRF